MRYIFRKAQAEVLIFRYSHGLTPNTTCGGMHESQVRVQFGEANEALAIAGAFCFVVIRGNTVMNIDMGVVK